jgi:hypothetical protein
MSYAVSDSVSDARRRRVSRIVVGGRVARPANVAGAAMPELLE